MSKINTHDRRRKVRSLRERDGDNCHWCGIVLDFRPFIDPGWVGHPELEWVATLDHYVPKTHGGSNKIKNLVLACDWCNQKRGHKTPNQFRKWLKRHWVSPDKRKRRTL